MADLFRAATDRRCGAFPTDIPDDAVGLLFAVFLSEQLLKIDGHVVKLIKFNA